MSAHQVRRARFRVKASRVPDLQQRQQWQQQFESRYLPLLDQALAAWLQQHPQLQNRIVLVKRLQLDLGQLRGSLDDDTLLLSLQRQLDSQLPRYAALSPESWQLQCYLQFLRSGSWPAGSEPATARAMEQWWLQHVELLPRFRLHLLHLLELDALWVRLCLQHSADFLYWLADSLAEPAVAAGDSQRGLGSALQATLQLWSALRSPSLTPPSAQAIAVLQEILRRELGIAASEVSPALLLSRFIRARQESAANLLEPRAPTAALAIEDATIRFMLDKEETDGLAASGIAVQQAGLVLLHPYLPQLFARLGLVHERQFINEACRLQALFVLHYAATGQRSADEGELALHKFLVDWPLDHSIPASVPLSEAHYAQIDDLLRAVIAHWTVLKNTSIEGLRESFLARAGLLRTVDGVHELVVTSSAIDLLLDQLPWSISLVKLPWQSRPLHVNWRQ